MDGIMIYGTAFQICASYDADTQCRLVGYMARYALTGEEPDFPEDDPARFIWPALKDKADRTVEAYEQRVSAGRNGGIKTQAQRKQAASESEAEAKRKSSEGQATSKRPSSETEAKAKRKSSEAQAEAKPESNTNTESNTDTETDKEHGTRARTREEAKAVLERFEKFWAAYPRHTDKKTALRAFDKIRPDDALLTRMLAAIEKQKQSDQWTRDGGAYIPHPSTWLNQERWTDELPKAVPRVKAVAAQQYEQRAYDHDEEKAQADDDMARRMAAWFAEHPEERRIGTA